MVRDGAGEFARVLRQQVAKAAAAQRSAQAIKDIEASEHATGLLADLLKIASDHGVDVSAALTDPRMLEDDNS